MWVAGQYIKHKTLKPLSDMSDMSENKFPTDQAFKQGNMVPAIIQRHLVYNTYSIVSGRIGTICK